MQLREKTSVSDLECDADDLHLLSQVRVVRRTEAARAGTTLLALLMGITVLGIASNGIAVYHATGADGRTRLALWPSRRDFDFRPTLALAAGAAVVIVCNVLALCSHLSIVRLAFGLAHMPLTLAAPFVGLVGSVVAMALFYSANASATVDTALSWSCRWRAIPMAHQPHFDTLCRTSYASVYLAVLLIPVQAATFVLAGYQAKVERFALAYADARKSPSPVSV